MIIAGNLVDDSEKSVKESMQTLDQFLEIFSSSIKIDVLPGENEPNSLFLPQQPLVRYFFEKSYQSQNLQAVTNPYHFECSNLNILGTSGKIEII